MVTDFDRSENAHLELPLAHHHFGVGTFDADTGALKGDGVSLDDVTSGHLRSAHSAVVRTLRPGVSNFGPAVGATLLEEGVLLFDTEERLEARVLLRDFHGVRALVGGVRRTILIE